MDTTLRQLADTWPALQTLNERPLPGLLALKLARFTRSVQSEVELLEETRGKLIMKHGEQNKDGYAVAAPDAVEAFFEEYNPVLDTAVVLADFTLSLDDFEALGDMTPQEAAALEWLIED